HAALAAFVDVIFRRFEFVFDEFEHRGIGEIRNRENRLEHGLQPLVGPPALRFLHQQELIVRRLLNLDEVRHLCDFLDFPEKLTNALATGECLRHYLLSFCRNRRGRDDSPEGRNPSRPSGQASKPGCLWMIRPWPNRCTPPTLLASLLLASFFCDSVPPQGQCPTWMSAQIGR